MLVLTRKLNQSIVIGDNIELTIVDLKGDQVKIGINAPKNIRIYRSEVYQAIEKQNIEASQSHLPEGMDNFLPPKKGSN